MKKSIITLGIIALVVGISLTFRKEEKELINITNNENNTLAFFIKEEGNYKGVETLPTSGYTLNEEKSFCSNGATPTWNDNSLEILSLNSSNTNCYLYFDKSASLEILENAKKGEGTPDYSKTSCTSGCGEATVGLYSIEDDDGKTYYYRGDVEDNYVKFANKYWRIVRINGNGSIRMVYDGENVRANGTPSSATQIGISTFNTSYNDNMYVGFKYTSGQAQGTGTKSTILTKLETWYSNNLLSYASKLDMNAGFCGDRRRNTKDTEAPNGTGGTGTTETYYAAWYRLQINKTPELSCDTSDFYTISEANEGNKSLTYPIGLITADEVAMAGGLFNAINQKYFLYTGQVYWTMSPRYFGGGNTYGSMYYVLTEGNLDSGTIAHNSSNGVRPVINLKADVELTGTGTMTDPYVVVGGN